MSTTLTRGAVVGAALTSALALADAAWQATGTGPAPWTPGEGIAWIGRAGDALHGLTYAAVAAALVLTAERIDAGRSAVRWLRRIIAADLGLLSVPFLASAAFGIVAGDGLLSTVSGLAFLALFPLGIALGAVLVARPVTRDLPAWVLLATLPLLGLTALAGAVGWGHPGYVETSVYLGLALLAAVPRRTAQPSEDRRAQAVPAT